MIDNIILNDKNYIGLIICLILSMVSNINISICIGNILYISIIDYIIIDIWLYYCICLFIDLQLKELIYYNGYMNDIVYISYLYLLFGIHFIHINICYVLLLLYLVYYITLYICISISYYYVSSYYICLVLFISIVILVLYYDLVGILWFILYYIYIL